MLEKNGISYILSSDLDTPIIYFTKRNIDYNITELNNRVIYFFRFCSF